MTIFLSIIVHLALIVGIFLGLVGSAKEYALPIIILEVLCAVSFAGFLLLFTKADNLFVKIYLIFAALISLFFIIDGFTRQFFEFRLIDFLK